MLHLIYLYKWKDFSLILTFLQDIFWSLKDKWENLFSHIFIKRSRISRHRKPNKNFNPFNKRV